MRPLLALLTLVAFVATSRAETPPTSGITPEVRAAFEPHSFEHDGFTLPYRLMRPEVVAEGEKRPLVLFLHGMGERGDDNLSQLIHGARHFAAPWFRGRHRAFVVAPQCPDGTEPGTVSRDPKDPPGTEAQRIWTYPVDREAKVRIALDREPTKQLAAVRALVDQLLERLPIDPDRVYVTGLSMGGYATWELTQREPEFWAAAMPICGAGDPTAAEKVRSLPIWVLHGDNDGAVKVQHSRDMVHAIETAGGAAIYTEFPAVGHDSWTPTFQNRFVWDWMFAQRRRN